MNKSTKWWEENPDFLEFVNREFTKTAGNATIQELAEFAFGSLNEAVRAFQQYSKGHTNED